MTTVEIFTVRKTFGGRRTSKSVARSLAILDPEAELHIKIYVLKSSKLFDRDSEIVIEVETPGRLLDVVNGAMAQGNDREEDVWINDCEEFYQRDGLTKFRGA